jgi:hypothetical protein
MTMSPGQTAAHRAERRRLQKIVSSEVHDTSLQAAQARARWQGAVQVLNAITRSAPDNSCWLLASKEVSKLLHDQHQAEERAERAMRRLASFDRDYSAEVYEHD